MLISPRIKQTLKKLGGRAILSDGENEYVVMELDEFEKFCREGKEDLTGNETVDMIDGDVDFSDFDWREDNEEDEDDIEYVKRNDDTCPF